jgi:N-acetylmuramoyl-L-alanine amidase
VGTYHIVQQGEYLSQIARQHGFVSYLSIWDHPQNGELKKKRKNPNVLLPGDRLFVPERERKEESAATEQKHRFETSRKKLFLSLVLEELYDKPISRATCELAVDGALFKLTTDGAGAIKQEIAGNAQHGRLTVRDVETGIQELPIAIRIGALDPVEEVSGQIARLSNLGYYRGPVDAVDEKERLSAVEEFQCDQGLKVDGVCGSRTQAKLKEVHGC